MKWLVTIVVATVTAGLALPTIAECEEPARQALRCLEGTWKGKIAGEDGASSKLGDLGRSMYSGTAKPTTDGESVLQIGSWSKVGVRGQIGWARLYKLGSEPNRLVVYTYSTQAHHAVVNATVKPHGEFFEIAGEETGVTPDRKVTASRFTLVITDEDHFTIKTTARTADGVTERDEVLEFVRKKG